MQKKDRTKKLILLGLVILIFVTIIYIEFGMKKTRKIVSNTELTEIEQKNKQENVGVEAGKRAPNFVLENLGGKKVTLWEFASKKAVILNFWATWCPPCKQEMPLLQSHYDKNKDKLEILAINLQEDPERVKDWTGAYKLSFQILLDPSAAVKKLYQVNAQPTTYFIDSSGIIRAKRVGQLTDEELPEQINKILAEDANILTKEDKISTKQDNSNKFTKDGDEIKLTKEGVKYIVDPKKLLSGGSPKDGIPSIDKPKYISAKEADKFLNDKELVMGIFYKDKPRAYPLQIMVWHEIVNDNIANEPILITYCPLCGTGIAFEGKIDTNNDGTKEAVEFGVSGKLYNSDLVMYDRATDTFWQQATGKAIVGELVGQRLKLLPIDTLTWQDWKKLYPETEVLSRNTGHFRTYGSSPYGDYDSNEEVYFPVDNVDDRLHPKTIVYGFEKDGKFKAYPDDELKKATDKKERKLKETQNEKLDGFVEDNFAGINLRITRTKEGTINAVNTDTNEEIGLIRSFWFAWVAFNPDTELYKAEK